MTQYTIAMTCSGGTAIAGDYIAENKRKALAMAKKENGDEWTYYVHKEKKIGLKGRYYFIARYWNDEDNQLEFDDPYVRIKSMRYGDEKDAEKYLKSVLENSDDKDWQIFWINTDRDDRKTPDSIRADIELKRKELELLKETDYDAWLKVKNDC
jgi:hypothetical protein